MSKLKFCCNISWLFREKEFAERFQLAANHGFKAVECGWPYPYDEDIDQLVAAKEAAGVEVVLMNSSSIQSLGSAAVPGSEDDFKKELELAIQHAKALDCKKIVLMAGQLPDDCLKYLDENNSGKHYPEFTKTFISNLQYASEKLTPEGITGLIEPIACSCNCNYFLTSSQQACQILDQVNRPNIKYQLDFDQLPLVEGNITENFEKLLPRIGHISISQEPSDREPPCSCELRYKYIFNLLESVGYMDWIGCEIAQAKGTQAIWKWFEEYLRE